MIAHISDTANHRHRCYDHQPSCLSKCAITPALTANVFKRKMLCFCCKGARAPLITVPVSMHFKHISRVLSNIMNERIGEYCIRKERTRKILQDSKVQKKYSVFASLRGYLSCYGPEWIHTEVFSGKKNFKKVSWKFRSGKCQKKLRGRPKTRVKSWRHGIVPFKHPRFREDFESAKFH